MTKAMTEPIIIGSKNPSKAEQKQVERAILEAWRDRKPIEKPSEDVLKMINKKHSKAELKEICGL